MRVLALNCGSSSVKCALLDSERRTRLLDVRVENIGRQDCRLEVDGERREAADILDLGGAVAGVLEHVRSRAAELGAPQAIAHRIVHGGAQFHQPTVLNDDVLAQIESLNSLAPLHNPPAIEAVRLAVAAYADVPHVAIFDTAWHGT